MSTETISQILDAKGQPIEKGSVVQIIDESSPWAKYKGLVVEPDSNIEGDNFRVAVFFNFEVRQDMFTHWRFNADLKRGIMDIGDWHRTFRDLCRNGETDFLLVEQVWKKCPRVVFFQPEALLVGAEYSIDDLVKRVFGKANFIYEPKDQHVPIESFWCWHNNCKNKASKIALFNVWGTIMVLRVCDGCFPKTHGIMADSAPEGSTRLVETN